MTTLTPSIKRVNPMAQVLGHRDFRLLWLGQATSLIGDQFALIAMPWLVLRLTGDPLALGAVLALAGIPRAVFMLLGGAITDRLSPRAIMLSSDIIRLALVTLVAALILAGAIQMWMVYAFSLAFGVVSGLFQPASISMVPSLVNAEELPAGNAMFQGTSQLAGFIGPALAGGVIGWFAHSAAQGTSELVGIGLAFSVDAATFLISVLTLWAMRAGRQAAAATDESVLDSIRAGIRYAVAEPAVKLMLVVVALANLLFAGPLLVGIPVLASTRLPEGAVAFGLIMSAYAGGNLLGIIVAGSLPKPGKGLLRVLMVGLLGMFGLALAAFGWIKSTWVAFAVLLLLGIGDGYFFITIITVLQHITPKEMLGRMMSLMLFAGAGLVPVSQAVSGAVSQWGLTGLFVGAGVLMVLMAAWAGFQPALTQLDSLLARTEAGT